MPAIKDVAVVGGGHNGLAGAAYLARAGLDVVLERRSPGGRRRDPGRRGRPRAPARNASRTILADVRRERLRSRLRPARR